MEENGTCPQQVLIMGTIIWLAALIWGTGNYSKFHASIVLQTEMVFVLSQKTIYGFYIELFFKLNFLSDFSKSGQWINNYINGPSNTFL